MGATAELASYILSTRLADLPADVKREAHRALLNYVGCARRRQPRAGRRYRVASADAVCRQAERAHSGPRRAHRPAARFADERHQLARVRFRRHDAQELHPSDVAGRVGAVRLRKRARRDRRDFLHAFILGFEAESRVGNAVYPAHYDVGWHITGTAGVFGAAAAIGKLLGLQQQKMVWALGLAATQAAGLREMFGSMGKAFHPGRSAQNGYAAALLAREGFTGSDTGIEGPRGFAAVQAAKYDLAKITTRLGTDFDLRANTYKPFPCGIVIHPTIDGCIQISRSRTIKPQEITAVRLQVAPLVLDLCKQKDIHDGLEGKFSVYHGAAIGLVRGKAGLAEFSDETVNDPDVKACANNGPRPRRIRAWPKMRCASRSS